MSAMPPETGQRLVASALLLVALLFCMQARANDVERRSPRAEAALMTRATSWADREAGAVRGITVGPIESTLHPSVGYGTRAGFEALLEARSMGANWVALTPFGRVWDLKGSGVDLRFEAPVKSNTRDIEKSIEHAHALGLKVMLVPHLWVESGEWRALINPADDEAWARWTRSYRRFLLHWTDLAARTGCEMLSVGVELRSWVTTARVASFSPLIDEVRSRYRGLLTYSANWDDAAYTMIWNQLDVIGVNAFFPLTDRKNANFGALLDGGYKAAEQLHALATEWDKPVLLTEMGYTTRSDPALRPWEWPEALSNVTLDQEAQAMAYRALLAPLVDEPWCAGFFVWRTYADPNDVSQEPEWGFSPRGKLAELVLRDAFATPWASDPHRPWLNVLAAQRARTPSIFAWH